MARADLVRVTVQRDSFLEPFVGGPAFRLVASGAGKPLSDVVAELDGAGARFAHLRMPVEADRAAPTAAGFVEVETLVTYECPVPAPPVAPPGARAAVRDARPGDAGPCAAIAEHALVSDRFHADPRMPPGAAGRLKAAWVRNLFAGRADHVLVAEQDGRVVGFNGCLLVGATAAIDLIAVDPAAQGAGVGRALIRAALRHYAGAADRLRAGTQASNDAARQLYLRTGFVEADRSRTFHRWWPVERRACAP